MRLRMQVSGGVLESLRSSVNDLLVEALYAKNTNPVINLLALEGTKALAESLPIIVNNPQDVDARLKAQYGKRHRA